MNPAILPDILGLALLILAYRPLLRRAGGHVDLWFLGWGLVLVNLVANGVSGPESPARPWGQFVIIASIELCGLCFVLAAGKQKNLKIDKLFTVAIAAPMLVHTALYSFASGTQGILRGAVFVGANVLFLAPAACLLGPRERRAGPLPMVAALFAVLAVGLMPVASSRPDLVADFTRTTIFVSAAYVCLRTASHMTLGVAAASTGLMLWALKFPLLRLYTHGHPDFVLARGFGELPQYLLIAGSILSLLEDHVRRTERLAMHDPLTDLPNRRFFEQRFEAALDEAHRDNTTLACLAIDVDNFKTINDTYGHPVGDQLLCALAVRLSWHMTSRDMLARTGGDEFSAMLAGVTDEHHLRFIAGAMMSAASVPVSVEGHSVDVCISIGIALSPDDADEIGDLRRMADEAMYRAKRRGGNLLVFAGDPPPEKPAETAPAAGGQVIQMTTPRLRVKGGWIE